MLCFYLLTGSYPFDGNDYSDILKAIIAEDKALEFPQNLSDSCKHFLSKMLCENVNKRWTAEEALESQWIMEHRYARELAYARESLIHVLEIAHLSSSTLLAINGMNSMTLSTTDHGRRNTMISGTGGESEDHARAHTMDYLLLPTSPADEISPRHISWTPSAISAQSFGINKLMNDIDVDQV